MKKGKNSKSIVTDVIDGLQKLYEAKMKPVEELYLLSKFGEPTLKPADIAAKPFVMFLGQYSTGKTTFINYLLESSYPGANVGPEPTTDKFVAIMHNKETLVIPGNAICARADMPFTALNKFGNDFLTKFECSLCPIPLLEDITLVDTPGVLAGEKQTIGRTYDFTSVMEWFIHRSDLIILCFDAHKLDISDEFRQTIESLKGHEDKVRVVLNKSDSIGEQELMRVYGALQWSLGKVLKSPEVVRVYVSSFWDKPYVNTEWEELFDKEKEGLLEDLHSIPRTATIRKVNEIVKRARAVRVHAYLIAEIHDQLPVFGKEKKKREILEGLNSLFNKVMFSTFPKLNTKLLAQMEKCISVDIPELLKMFPMEQVAAAETNPFECQSNFDKASSILHVSEDKKAAFIETFNSLSKMSNGRVSGKNCKDVLVQSNLPNETLSKIWKLCDRGNHGALSQDEFVIAMSLVDWVLAGNDLPAKLPVV